MQSQIGLRGPQPGQHLLRCSKAVQSHSIVLRKLTCDRRSRQRTLPVYAAATSTKEPVLEVRLAQEGG